MAFRPLKYWDGDAQKINFVSGDDFVGGHNKYPIYRKLAPIRNVNFVKTDIDLSEYTGIVMDFEYLTAWVIALNNEI